MADFCGVNPQVSSRPRGVVLSIALHVFSAPELSARARFWRLGPPANASFVPLAR